MWYVSCTPTAQIHSDPFQTNFILSPNWAAGARHYYLRKPGTPTTPCACQYRSICGLLSMCMAQNRKCNETAEHTCCNVCCSTASCCSTACLLVALAGQHSERLPARHPWRWPPPPWLPVRQPDQHVALGCWSCAHTLPAVAENQISAIACVNRISMQCMTAQAQHCLLPLLLQDVEVRCHDR